MKKAKKVIPGFGLTMGFSLIYLSLVVLIPLGILIIRGSSIGIEKFIASAFAPRVLHGYLVSFGCSFIAGVVNSIFGLILAWILVRYDFPFKRIIDGLIDLPFALPTSVAGISLTTLYSENGFIGKILYEHGIKSSFSVFGITVALIFIGIPFVVRNVQPVLEELDPKYEEAAEMMGAGRIRTFVKVIFPEILPALLAGFGLAFARGLGEYGSVVFIAGNMPMKTEIVPLLIMSKLEQYDYDGAVAIALIMLITAFVILFAINIMQYHFNKLKKG